MRTVLPQPTVTMGGVTILLSKAIFLYATGSTTANVYYAFKKADGNNYQVPAGKTLKLWAAQAITPGTTPTGSTIGYGDTAGPGTTSQPTAYVSFNNLIYSSTNGVPSSQSVGLNIPAGKYPVYFHGNTQAAAFVILCTEE